jgi:hypothetical protein
MTKQLSGSDRWKQGRLANMKTRTPTAKTKWYVYIPDDGDWPINYSGTSIKEARAAWLKSIGEKSLMRGSYIWY